VRREDRPGEEVAGARVGMRAHEYNDQQIAFVLTKIRRLGIRCCQGGQSERRSLCEGTRRCCSCGSDPRKPAPSASQLGRRDRQEEIQRSSDHSRRRKMQSTSKPDFSPELRQAMQSKSIQTSPYATGYPEPTLHDTLYIVKTICAAVSLSSTTSCPLPSTPGQHLFHQRTLS
jgi:hypothetical protein